jgi:hypothetical protein
MLGAKWAPLQQMVQTLTQLLRRSESIFVDEEKHPSKPKWLDEPVIQTSRERFLNKQIPKFGIKQWVLGSMTATVANSSSASSSSIHAATCYCCVAFRKPLLFLELHSTLAQESRHDDVQERMNDARERTNDAQKEQMTSTGNCLFIANLENNDDSWHFSFFEKVF